MTFDPALIDAVEELSTISWTGEVHRFTSGGRSPNRENTFGARWNPAGVATIYTALTRETLGAEFRHALSAWNPPPNPSKFTAYRLHVSVKGVLDLRSEEALKRVGLTRNDFASATFTACQRVGGAAHWVERAGLLVPSAREANGSNLVIFTDWVGNDFVLEELGSEPMHERLAAG